METLRRNDSAVDRLNLGSRRAALNAALVLWLNHVEWNAVRDHQAK